MAPAPVQAAQSTAQSTAQRVTRWADENRAVALALGLAAVGGVGGAYYFYTRNTSSSRQGPGGPEIEAGKDGEKSGKKKKSKKGKKSGTATPKDSSEGGLPKDPNGPLLDEASDEQLFALSEVEIQKLPQERRQTLAQALKNAGNKAYTSREFEKAIEHYTKAIAAHPLAVFYSNRAACYSNLQQPARVVPDCDAALRLDRTYVKALNRRAVAKEALGSAPGGSAEGADDTPDSGDGPDVEERRKLLFESLCDFTSVAILGQFKDESATNSVERVLKKIATAKAADILRTREPKLPSPTFVTAYLEAFRQQPTPALPENPSQGDNTLARAYEALGARDYPHALTLFSESLEQGLSNQDLEAAALNMRGTFKFVIGNAKSALDDLERSTTLRPDYVQSWVKKASVHMELSDKDEAFRDFDMAIKANADDPDIYYHRGQVHFILGEFEAAIADYQKSTSLDDTFIFSQVQYAVAQYKTGNVGHSTASFRKLLRSFGDSSEAYNYYGELLLDQQRFEDALEKFDRAIEIEASKPTSSNVLPMINKALALFQWKQDMPAAERLCRQALERDPDCDVAVATLAQLSLQQGKIKEAIDFFERSAQIARTEPELVNAITYENASRAQLQFIQDFPEQGAALGQMASVLS